MLTVTVKNSIYFCSHKFCFMDFKMCTSCTSTDFGLKNALMTQ